MNIPRNIDRIRELSDVVLLAEDADGNEKELHTCRAYLSMFSSFFKNLFFSNFKEANSDSVKVSCGYEILKLILEILHEHCCDFTMKEYDPDTLAELFKAADYLDIPAITKMCVEQILGRPSVEMAKAVLSVAEIGEGVHDILMELFTKLPKSELLRFFKKVNGSQLFSQQLFSKEDVASIYQLHYSSSLPCPSQPLRTWSCTTDLPDVGAKCRFYCPKSLYERRIGFITKNSNGKMLYFFKLIFSISSTRFKDMLRSSPGITEIEVDVDYLIMKNILAILGGEVDDIRMSIKSSPFLIYNMYRAAAEDNLDIPMIRQFCLSAILEDTADCISWDLAVKLNLPYRDVLLAKMNGENLLKWLHSSSDEEPSEYFTAKGSEYEVHYSNKKKPILSMYEVRIIVKRIGMYYLLQVKNHIPRSTPL